MVYMRTYDIDARNVDENGTKTYYINNVKVIDYNPSVDRENVIISYVNRNTFNKSAKILLFTDKNYNSIKKVALIPENNNISLISRIKNFFS